ncbi:dienelactone hydrolase family protein [Spirillospora sp. CA-108201]
MITLRLPDAELTGDLDIPDGARGVVLFAHGSGSSRHSPRNRAVAAGLNAAGIGTLLIDLLTGPEEEADRVTAALRFDIDLLTRRLVHAADDLVEGLESAPHTAGLPIGLFGASTGAAAALGAAAARPRIAAVVSRGGRPDLAGPALAAVRAPVLLIVGGRDTEVLELNERAHRSLATSEVHVISGAGHLFEEPGALEEVTAQAADWFTRHL